MTRWPIVNVRRVATLGTGHTPSRQHVEYWGNCTIPWLTLADVWQLRDGTKSIVTETAEMVSKLGVENSSAVVHPAGTVAMSRTASVGFSCILGQDMATSQDFVTWTCGPLLEPRFLLHSLRGQRDSILGMQMGSTHQTIYMPDVERITTALPSIQEQLAISSFLDAEVVSIDAVIAKKRRLIRLLEERATGEIDRALDLRLDWSRAGVPRPLTERWPVLRLGLVAGVQTGLTLDGAREVDPQVLALPYVRVANVQDGSLDLSELKEVRVPPALANRCMLRAGDVLMTEGGDSDKLGRGAVWPGVPPHCLHQNHVFAVRATARLRPEYLGLLTRSTYARAYFEVTAVKTTGIASTSTTKISAFRIPLPDLATQTSVVRQWTKANSTLRSAIEQVTRQIKLLQEHRQALITAAITGKLDVSGAAA